MTGETYMASRIEGAAAAVTIGGGGFVGFVWDSLGQNLQSITAVCLIAGVLIQIWSARVNYKNNKKDD
jgi:hypothetical protein